MKNIKSPIRYPGGKSILKKYFVHLFPDADNFVDMFCGGGSITIEGVNRGYKNIISNDIDTALIELHKGNIDTKKLLKIFSKSVEEKKQHFELAKQNIEKPENYFIINKFGFSGLMKGTFSARAAMSNGNVNSVYRLEKMIEHNKNVKFTNISFESLTIPKNSFIYADPPYYANSKKDLYRKGHKKFDHDCFIEYIKSINEKWLITYDDCEYIREQFKDYKIIPFSAAYKMTNTNNKQCKKGKEIIIMNFER